jgi:hypothetical protein
VPQQYRDLATPAGDQRLLADYRPCARSWPVVGTIVATRHTRLAVHSRPPTGEQVAALPGWRHDTYHLPGRFPHLADVDRIVRDIRTLL